MHFQGVLLGLISLALIGVLHPVVIKGEFYCGAKIWIFFLLGGVLSLAASLFIENFFLSAAFGILGFDLLWCVPEVVQQKKRVEKGWFPKGPSHRGKP